MTEQKSYKTIKPSDTYEIGARLALQLTPGDVILLFGGLGAGKTLFTKGILDGMGYDPDEVTSPSFSLVNLYKAPLTDVYHIDLWRIEETADAGAAVGLGEILEPGNSVTIIEWPERLSAYPFRREPILVTIQGSGDDPRIIEIKDDAV